MHDFKSEIAKLMIMTTLIHPLQQYIDISQGIIAMIVFIGIILLIGLRSSKLKVGLVWITAALFHMVLSIFGYSIFGIMFGLFTLSCGLILISLSTSNMSKNNRMLAIVGIMLISLIEFIFTLVFSFLSMPLFVASLVTLSCGIYAFYKSESMYLRSKISS